MRCLNLLKLLSLPVLAVVTWEASNSQGLTTPLDATPSRPIEGSTAGLHLPNQTQLGGSQFPSPTSSFGVKVHLDPVGKPCMKVSAYSHKQPNYRKIFDPTLTPRSSSNIFEHFISAQNHCSQPVKLKVCYYGSQSCVMLEVPGYDRREALLGVYPALADFRYQYVEQF
jgi:hypothetical protein